LQDKAGATAIEYGLIAVATISAMQGMSGELQTTFKTVSSGMQAGNSI